MNNDNIFTALGTFLEAMRPFLVNVISKHHPGEPWEGVFFGSLTAEKQSMWNQAIHKGTEPMLCIDYHNLSFLATRFRDELAAEIGGKDNTYIFDNCMRELKEARNKCQHFTPLSEDEKDRAFSNMITLANMVRMPDLKEEINRLRHKHTYTPVAVAPVAVTTVTTEPAKAVIADDNSPLTPWWRNCMPHYDIRSGALDESVFAANLNEVAMGAGPEVYNNPTTFFQKTYVTAGLRDITKRVVKALNGEETENRVISLQTGFGGGKTHTLISIYHIVKGGANLLNSAVCRGLLPADIQPTFNNAKVAVFTNNTCDLVQGRTTDDGITIHTLWGEIAYQLGGKEAYDTIRQNDEMMIAPTTSLMKPILEKAGTSLILVDELAAYCASAADRKTSGSNLFVQTNTFIQNLTEVVSQVPRSVLIATLPASKSEVANSEVGQQVLDSLQDRIVRVGANVKPVDDEEVFEVVRRRLFEQIFDVDIIDQVAMRYKRMYHNRRNDLPDYADKMEYANLIKKSYPFHPELINMFREGWGSDSKFQRTRGVLRLLASIVQDLWRRRENLTGTQALIHTSDVALGNLASLTGTITNLMGSQWETVMTADVYGSSSNARKIDEQDPGSNIGQYSLTQGVATTLLMASIGAKANKGLDIKKLKLCVLRPDAFNHNDVDGVLNRLEGSAHYMHTSKVGTATYWFESKANVNILLSQAKADVKIDEINNEIQSRLRSSVGFVNGIHVLVCPSGDVPEQKQLSLVIMNPQYAMPVGTIPRTLEHAIKEIALKKGNSDRIYRNTILYLLASEAGRSALNDKLEDYLACDRILQEKGGSLEKDQKQDLQNRKAEYNKQAGEALIRTYNTVVKCSAKDGLERYELKNYAADFSTQITQNLLSELMEEEWIIKGIGRNLLNKINMLPEPGHAVSVKELYETFLRFDDKPMIVNQQAVIETVNRFCSANMFNVAVGDEGHYTKIYVETTVPFLDVTSEDYWLVDTSVKPAAQGGSGQGTGGQDDGGSGDDTGNGDGGNGTGGDQTGGQGGDDGNGGTGTPKPKTYKKVQISGQVPLENYTQLWTSFVQTLKNNNLKIEISFKASSTSANPLTENSATIKSVKESASQLGLDFDVEE